ncbi:MAG: transporter substrate-binding domain-containing protein [Methanocalculus sp.]|uniref:cache domain-containing protein n=1 Tax=Methanocalculus sp. TaxID=2004547 RepID=UPI002716C428|nr:transporter substrate-binding domain-containing protein [Methanocalculus sp.]MDO9539638.1 transporter substrate-binding domain-containing protein [Methanocalculus sp.]
MGTSMRGFLQTIAIILIICLLMTSAGCVGRDITTGPPADSGLRIVTEENPPYNYLGTDGEAAGQSTEVVREILKRQHQTSLIEVLPWSEGYAIALSTPDVILFSTAKTPERESLFSWVGPVGKLGFVFYAGTGSKIDISGLDEILDHYTVGVVRDDWRHQYLDRLGFEKLILVTDDTEAIRGVMNSEIDLWFGSSDTVIPHCIAAGVDPSSLEPVYTLREVELFIAFSEGTPESTVKKWQATLDAMKKDGTFEEIVIREQDVIYSRPAGLSGVGKEALALLVSKADARFSGTAKTLHLLASTSDLRSGNREVIQPVLASLRANDPQTNFVYVSSDGTWYLQGDSAPRADTGNRPYLSTLLKGTSIYGLVITDPVTGREAAVVAVPVTSGNEVIGALEALIDLTTLSHTFNNELALSDTAYFSALTEEGIIALQTHPEKIGQAIPTGADSYSEAARTALRDTTGEVGYEVDGRYYQAAFQASSITGWRFIIAEQSSPPIPPKTHAEEELEALLELHD